MELQKLFYTLLIKLAYSEEFQNDPWKSSLKSAILLGILDVHEDIRGCVVHFLSAALSASGKSLEGKIPLIFR